MAADECEALAVWSVAAICRELSLQNVRNFMHFDALIMLNLHLQLIELNLHLQLIDNAKI